MIKYDFDRILKARGIERPFTYLRNAGFNDHMATRIKNNRVIRLELKHLERLCLLLRCTPNDLLVWTSEKGDQIDKQHPMNEIRKSEHEIDFIQTINSIPIGKLEEIDKLIKEEVSKMSSDG